MSSLSLQSKAKLKYIPQTPSTFTAFDSPRTKQACEHLGIAPDELVFKSKEQLLEENPSGGEEVAALRWKVLEE